jgi:hypothetical protein
MLIHNGVEFIIMSLKVTSGYQRPNALWPAGFGTKCGASHATRSATQCNYEQAYEHVPANPWSRWYWNDWDGDEQLKLCSLAAQGLWMRMLSIAARAEPIGYVAVKSRPCSPEDIATLTGSRIEEVELLLLELRERGVFSVARSGAIYNRRMVDDEKKRQKLRENGSAGGRARVLKQQQKFYDPKQNIKQIASNPPSPTESTESTIPLKEKDSRCKPMVRTRVVYENIIEEFWKAYPHRGGEADPKKPAADMFRLKIKAGADPAVIIAGATRYATSVATNKTEPKFVAQAVTWLRQERWNDGYEQKPNGHDVPISDPVRLAEIEDIKRRARESFRGRESVESEL